jgi:hypothetical protein
LIVQQNPRDRGERSCGPSTAAVPPAGPESTEPRVASFPPMMHIRKRKPALEILMNSTHYYHTQPKPISTRARCPVCNQAAYSLAGIHPQCAERQAEPPRPKVKPPEAGDLIAQGAEGEATTAVQTSPAIKRMPYGRGRRPLTPK